MAMAAVLTTDKVQPLAPPISRFVEPNSDTVIMEEVGREELMQAAVTNRTRPARGALVGVALGAGMWAVILRFAIAHFIK